MTDGKPYEVLAARFAELGLRLGGATKRCYRCNDAGAVLMSVEKIRGPTIAPGKRGLDEQRLRSILSGIALDAAMPPVPVCPEPAGDTVLLDCAHRFAVSLAYGFRELPCQPLTRDQAEGVYGYPWGQMNIRSRSAQACMSAFTRLLCTRATTTSVPRLVRRQRHSMSRSVRSIWSAFGDRKNEIVEGVEGAIRRTLR